VQGIREQCVLYKPLPAGGAADGQAGP
jgi:hypothetical protein